MAVNLSPRWYFVKCELVARDALVEGELCRFKVCRADKHRPRFRDGKLWGSLVLHAGIQCGLARFFGRLLERHCGMPGRRCRRQVVPMDRSRAFSYGLQIYAHSMDVLWKSGSG